MPNVVISEDIRLRLAQSMAVVERRKLAILKQITDRMAARAHVDETSDPAAAATTLFTLLMDGASDLAAFAGLRDLSRVRREHKRRRIAGRQYSRFGLALGPAFRSELGIAMSPQTVAAWCDAFWIVIRETTSAELPEPRKRLSKDQIVLEKLGLASDPAATASLARVGLGKP